MAKKQSKDAASGRWRIVSMSNWDDEYIDAEEEGYFKFEGTLRLALRDLGGYSVSKAVLI